MTAPSKPPYRILFVCLGNTCRSPTAEGVFRQIMERRGSSGLIELDSAGIGAWHTGNPPNPRGQAAALKRGYDLSGITSRQITASDFDNFDLIVAMDHQNVADLEQRAPADAVGRIKLFSQFVKDADFVEVPDPYHGDESDYEHALDLILVASEGLADHVESAFRM